MKKRLKAFIVLLSSLFLLYTPAAKATMHTQSNLDDVRVTHMSMTLTLLMKEKKFEGAVFLTIENLTGAKELHLDTDGLVIHLDAIGLRGLDNTYTPVTAKLHERHAMLGQKLVIPIKPDTKEVIISYETKSDAKGLDWVPTELTGDKIAPMVFTQFQPKLARSFVPCQDAPSNRITYDARVTVKDDLPIIVLMAAEHISSQGNTFQFVMKTPIPTYLIALAAGHFKAKAISPIITVYAEPSVLEKAAFEFADAPSMMDAARGMFGDYLWDRWDLLLMPPSFTFGGMENPRLTFLSQTVVTGDRSNVDVVIHELAHSWSGNLVTNKDWRQLWLNEGFTVYVERLIIKKMYGTKMRNLEIALGQRELALQFARFFESNQERLTALFVPMTDDDDPEHAITSIPYEKGSNFLLWLESLFGEEKMVAYLKQHFKTYAFKSVDTPQVFTDMKEFFALTREQIAMAEEWLYSVGVPSSGLPQVQSELIAGADALSEKLQRGDLEDVAKWQQLHPKQWAYLLKGIKDLDAVTVKRLDEQFSLSNRDADIKAEFFRLAVNAGIMDCDAEIVNFLKSTGRTRYLKPVFLSLVEMAAKTESNRERLQRIWQSVSPDYNALTKMILMPTLTKALKL